MESLQTVGNIFQCKRSLVRMSTCTVEQTNVISNSHLSRRDWHKYRKSCQLFGKSATRHGNHFAMLKYCFWHISIFVIVFVLCLAIVLDEISFYSPFFNMYAEVNSKISIFHKIWYSINSPLAVFVLQHEKEILIST